MKTLVATVLSIIGCGPDVDYAPSEVLLTLVSDVELPGRAARFDYQAIDPDRGQLVVAHMNDSAVVVIDLDDGSVLKRITGIPTARGVAIAPELGIIFVTSSPSQLVLIDSTTLEEIDRVPTGHGPDGDAWDPVDRIVGVSDQSDGALSLIADAGSGARTQVALGDETGNVIYDEPRGRFWITVVDHGQLDALVAVDPLTATVTTTIPLPGCKDAHGLRLHPDGQSAFVACEGNATLARVALDGSGAVVTGAAGASPDVLSIDPGLGWLYVAAESDDLTIFDINQPGIVLLGHDYAGPSSHTVQVDPASHKIFFPLESGKDEKPVLRIMRPKEP